MAKIHTFSHRRGEEILQKKGLLREITEVSEKLKGEDARWTKKTHNKIRGLFKEKNWEEERYVFREMTWKWDAYKDKVAVSIEFGGIEAIHRDFLRGLLLKHTNKIDALVLITQTEIAKAHFENVKGQIELFAPILDFPIYLIGFEVF